MTCPSADMPRPHYHGRWSRNRHVSAALTCTLPAKSYGFPRGKDSQIVTPRIFKIALAALMAAAVAAPAAQAAPSTTVVIQGVAFRGPTGGNDEYIQIKNVSTSPQAIGGWEIWGSNATGSAVGSRAKIAAGVTL